MEITVKQQFPQHIQSVNQFDQFIDEGVIGSLAPAEMVVSQATKILTIGSCFALEIAQHLEKQKYDVKHFAIAERLFNAFALAKFVKAMAENLPVAEFQEHWAVTADQVRDMRARIIESDLVIVTFGLSIVWHDLQTGRMVFDPAKKLGSRFIYENPDRYEMRQTDIEANAKAMWAMLKDLRRLNPKLRVVLTLSPIPLRLAACEMPVAVADCLSKATLRMALAQIMARKPERTHYYPSFELLRWVATMVGDIWFEDDMLLHIKRPWVDYTVGKFMQHYGAGDGPAVPAITLTGV